MRSGFEVELPRGATRLRPIPSMKSSLLFPVQALCSALLMLVVTASAQESVMVIEAYYGKVLVAENDSAKRLIASLTKIATGAVPVH